MPVNIIEEYWTGCNMYDNPEDLIRRIQLGEDSTLELKEIRWKED